MAKLWARVGCPTFFDSRSIQKVTERVFPARECFFSVVDRIAVHELRWRANAEKQQDGSERRIVIINMF